MALGGCTSAKKALVGALPALLSVVFASAGTWRYPVNDGFAGAIHTYPPVEIGDGSASAVVPVSRSHGGPNVWLAVLAAVVAGVGTGLGARLLRRPASLSRPAEV